MSSLGSAFSFAPARVFVLTGGQLSVYHWRRGVVDMPGTTYVADEGGLRGFATYLSDTPDLASYFVVDLVEEEFRHELWGYRKFKKGRDISEQRPWADPGRDRLKQRLELRVVGLRLAQAEESTQAADASTDAAEQASSSAHASSRSSDVG